MRVLSGIVMPGYGLATKRLAVVQNLLAERIDLPSLHLGTLNLRLPAPYFVKAEAMIEQYEYDGMEFLKLQRCRIKTLKCCIMRPSSHEESMDASRVLEIMAPIHLRGRWGLEDGDALDVEVEGDEAWWSS